MLLVFVPGLVLNLHHQLDQYHHHMLMVWYATKMFKECDASLLQDNVMAVLLHLPPLPQLW
jgi:hypothetical protein